MIESKQFDRKKIIADQMEQDFMTKYFGSNEELGAFAKNLLHNKTYFIRKPTS